MHDFKPIQILLVEDNPGDVELTRRALSKSRVVNDLHVVRDGQEALEYLLGDGRRPAATPRPDLILLDLNLPRVNGIEVLQKIRTDEVLSLIPVIMLTSSDREDDVVRSYKCGCNTYIQK